MDDKKKINCSFTQSLNAFLDVLGYVVDYIKTPGMKQLSFRRRQFHTLHKTLSTTSKYVSMLG
jgi:hypothetical protein